MIRRLLIACAALPTLLAGCGDTADNADHPWVMHVIDDSYSGADGVDLVDIDGDGDADALVGWEESGTLLLHENPGPARVREHWRHTPVNGGLDVGKIEDARAADLDGDGAIDAVVSATEKGSERVGVHWLLAPEHPHDAGAWRGTWLDDSLRFRYLKVAIGQVDGRDGRDIVAGAKADGMEGALVWYQAPAAPGPDNADRWVSHYIDRVDWIDSVLITDLNGDGRNDILMNYWDNLVWYENRAPAAGDGGLPHWQRHVISTSTKSYFAECSGRAPGDLLVVGADLATAQAGDVVVYLVGKAIEDGVWRGDWVQREVRASEAVPRDPGETDYKIKGIACGNLDADPRPDIVISTSGRGRGVFALMNLEPVLSDQTLHLQVIAPDLPHSRKGVKLDNVVLEDLDGDGDLDVVSTEENGASGFLGRWLPALVTRGLGLIWFENPGVAPD